MDIVALGALGVNKHQEKSSLGIQHYELYNNPMLIILPRTLAIIYIAFISLFALDVFGEGYGFFGTMLALFMHLIPSFILILCLVLAWKKPIIGGAIFVVLGIIFTLWFRTYQRIEVFLIISLPLFVIGIFFIVDGISKGGAEHHPRQ